MKRRSTLSEKLAGAEGRVIKPQLTSLIDVMMLLLFFLIHSFSAEVIVQSTPRDLVLPQSRAVAPVKELGSIEVTKHRILLNGRDVVKLSDISGGEDPLRIDPLFERLDALKKPSVPGRREIMIQADRDVDFSVVKKVMYTASRAGFTDYTILVLQEGL